MTKIKLVLAGALVLLIFGCEGETPNRYQDALSHFPSNPTSLSVGLQGFLLQAESLRYGATSSPEALATSKILVGSLLSLRDPNQDGIVGWGQGEIEYAVETGVVLEGLLRAVENGVTDPLTVREIMRDTLLGWTRYYFVQLSLDQGAYRHVANQTDSLLTINATAQLSGVFAEILSKCRDFFTEEEAQKLELTLTHSYNYIPAQFRPTSTSWPYSNQEPLSFNDLAHHLVILVGLDSLERFLGKPHFSWNFDSFSVGGVLYEYPIEAQRLYHFQDPYSREARPGAVGQLAFYYSLLGERELAETTLEYFEEHYGPVSHLGPELVATYLKALAWEEF